ncbi:MAG: type II toxin-antitoxin system RelB/DinJ family antitoxin [Treponema sp.]|uniref:type II toxin-antitoxin system RelB/DinJ family antitoxin n=1 Tax=uncultured Treponema sp. TaxID=162155 RepID=UPI0023558060|nr:type II toxin-antitoxin system RelB/DinJ family antitoxin [uncultured Treponema sp.]MCI5645406.1 type II toxin-antitoxin system RelB/DinJ family antitoxin [Treponema porcinum]MDY4525171.1 type II toxin-antitoxin system RelB/DinJ family antitoxin [Treponema sp.]MDY5683119.1 type II toxin-antitoxin system RelB/DinJ family antitoxin [Treponema sp.]
MSNLLQVRVDNSVRTQAEEIFHNLGLDMSSAVRLFLNRVVLEQGLPFRMTLPQNTEEEYFDPISYFETH